MLIDSRNSGKKIQVVEGVLVMLGWQVVKPKPRLTDQQDDHCWKVVRVVLLIHDEESKDRRH